MALQSITGMKPYPLPEPTDVGPIETELKGATAKREQAFEKVQRLEELGIQRKRAEEETKATVDYEQTRELAKRARDFVKEQETMPEAQTLKRKREEMQDMAFVPSRANMEELATLFSLIGVVGVAIGAGGKQNALAAMSAMNGMVEGYNKGRTDIYKREKDQFEAYVKNQRVLMENLVKDYEQALKLRQANKEAGDLEVKSIFAKYGADQLKAISEKYGDAKGIEIAKNVLKDATDAETRVKSRLDKERDFNLKVAEAQRRLLAEQRTREHQQRMESRGQKQVFQGDDGKMYMVDLQTNQVTPVAMPEGVTSLTKAGSRAGQNALTFASRVYGNIENATADLRNIVALPATAELPVLAGLLNVDRDTALRSLESLVARKITNKENRAFQQVSDQLGAALARLEAQGLASGATKANIQAFNSLRPAAGDNAINMAIYIARVKQEIQTGIRVHDKMPGATEEQKRATKTLLDSLDKIVPYDTEDTLKVLRGKKATLGDKMQRLVQQPTVAESLQTQSGAAATPTTPAATPAAPPAVKKEKARPGEQIFQDASGNKAVLRGGQYVEVE